jgi:hypothetical protein
MLISSMLKSPPMVRYEQTKPLGAANGTVLAFYRADFEGIGLRSPHGDILQAIQPIFKSRAGVLFFALFFCGNRFLWGWSSQIRSKMFFHTKIGGVAAFLNFRFFLE